MCGPGRGWRRPGCAQAGPAELAVLYETGSQRLLRERNPLALSSSRRETVVGRTRVRGQGTTSSACGRRGGPAARSRRAPPGDRQETASGTPGLRQGPSSSWRWVGSCGLLSRELWRWGTLRGGGATSSSPESAGGGVRPGTESCDLLSWKSWRQGSPRDGKCGLLYSGSSHR